MFATQQPGQQFIQAAPHHGPTTIFVPIPPQGSSKYNEFASIVAIWIGVLLIMLGSIMIILNGVDIGFGDIFGYFGQGITAGIFVSATSIFWNSI